MDTPRAASNAGAARAADLGDVPRLCARLRDGDPDAFETLYRAWFPRVIALARSATRRDEAFALDIAQDVMLRVASRLPVLTDENALAAWMCRCTLNRCRDLLRRESRRRTRDARAARHESSPPPSTSTPEEIESIASMVASLPPMDYDLIMARVARGATLREAGLASGLSDDAAHGRLRRALASLRTLATRIIP
ncbi:MAG: hypothetical protein HBSAPP03_29820 [Phycisphaerae bacterium]|nr:MAG: hypothetical protein HBSAPP03_29820 [Phycisphaerae bacterium]